jgi:hypothetical protein
MALISLLTAILATYRLAHLLPEDEGPFFVFVRIRNFLHKKAALSYCIVNSVKDEHMEIIFEPHEVTTDMLLSDDNRDLGLWINLYSGINCAYCCGLYAAVLIIWLQSKNKKWSDLFVLIFAIAGGQSLLQKWSER